VTDRIVLVGCGATKVASGPVEAQYLYTGPYFRACRNAAKAIAPDRWYILSAMHGLLQPGTLILPYDRQLTDPLAVTPAYVAAQASHLGILRERAVVLAGRNYAELAARVWVDVERPLAHLGIGLQLQALAAMARAN
jgi:hypothetical protein